MTQAVVEAFAEGVADAFAPYSAQNSDTPAAAAEVEIEDVAWA